MISKTIMIGLVALAFVAGSIVTGTIAFADDDDDDELSQLACEAGKAMTGILFEDDEEITAILCGAQLQGPQGEQGTPGVDTLGNLDCGNNQIAKFNATGTEEWECAEDIEDFEDIEIIRFNDKGGSLRAGDTRFVGIDGPEPSGNENVAVQIVGINGKITKMIVKAPVMNPFVKEILTLTHNFQDTPLSCTLDGAIRSCVSTGSISVQEGDFISIKVHNPGTGSFGSFAIIAVIIEA